MKGKLVEFPESILDALAEYKKTTGMSASEYIRNATCRRMIVDGVITLVPVKVEINNKGNGSKIKVDTDAIEGNKFCDGESCEIPIQLPPQKNC